MPLSERQYTYSDEEGKSGDEESATSYNDDVGYDEQRDRGHPGNTAGEEHDAAAAAAAAATGAAAAAPGELPLYSIRPPLWVELSNGNRIDIHRPHSTHLGNVKAPEEAKKAGWWHAFSCSSDAPDEQVFCNLCGSAIKVTHGGSTSSMLRHLRRCNEEVYVFCAKMNERVKKEAEEERRASAAERERKRKLTRSGEAEEAFLRAQSNFARIANIPMEMFEHPSYKEMCQKAASREHLGYGRKKRTPSPSDNTVQRRELFRPPPPPPPSMSRCSAGGEEVSPAAKYSMSLAENLKFLVFGHLFYNRPIDGVEDEQAEMAYDFCRDETQLAGDILADGQEYKRRCENRRGELSAAESIQLLVTVASKRAKNSKQSSGVL